MPSDLPTMSALDRAAECPASEALPHARRAGTVDRERGVVKHAYLESVGAIGQEAALAEAPEKYRVELSRIDLSPETGLGELVDRAKFSQEVTFAFDVETGKARVLGTGLGRDYSAATENEVVGTADVVGLTADAVVVPDVKTGHAYLDPSRMRQLKGLTLAAAVAYARSRGVSGVVLLREDGTSYFKRVEFDEFDLSEFELELREIVAAVRAARARAERGERVFTVEGDHCAYCPAFDSCPSKMALVKAYAAAPEALGIGALETATEEELVRAYERATALAKVNERVLEVLKARARKQPLHLGGGNVLGVSPVDVISSDAASMVIEALYGPAVAKASAEAKPKVTKASIDRALRTHVLKPGMQITKMVEEVVEQVRKANGIVERPDVKKRKARPEDFGPPALGEGDKLEAQLAESVAMAEAAKSNAAPTKE